MATIRLTKEFSFEAAHALDGYDGPCREIHGHSYRLFVTVKGRPSTTEGDPKCGMVLDFGVLKRIVHEEIVARFDHWARRSPDASATSCGSITSPRARTCSTISRGASAAGCPRGSRSMRSACTRRRPRSPSGSPKIIFDRTLSNVHIKCPTDI